MALFGLYKTRKEREREERQRQANELELILATQRQLGEELTRALMRAAVNNKVYNVMSNGEIFEEATVHGFRTGKE